MPTNRPSARRSAQAALVLSAVVGIVLGALIVFRPTSSLLAVATLLGAALVVSGVLRIVTAVADTALSTPLRVLTGVVGVAVTLVGVLVLARPLQSLVLVALLIGIGWLFGGVRDLVLASRLPAGTVRTLGLVAGVLQLLGAATMLLAPLLTLTVTSVVAGVLLIVVSLASLLTLPSRSSR